MSTYALPKTNTHTHTHTHTNYKERLVFLKRILDELFPVYFNWVILFFAPTACIVFVYMHMHACVCVCVFACMCVCIVIYACTMSSACVDYLICTFSFLLFFLLQHSLSQCTCMCECVCSLINEIMFHPFSELFTGCPSKLVLNISCQHSVTPFSLIQPLFVCLTFSMSTLHQDNSAPHLTQELYAFCT